MRKFQVFIVYLRRPKKNDSRSDPFWEFGSFGCTRCHRANLLHPIYCKVKDGDRLAFVQGGSQGTRVLLVTPPVERLDHPNDCIEIRWDKCYRPFKYGNAAPQLTRVTDFPLLHASIRETKRNTMDAKLASRFRARSTALEPNFAREIIGTFEKYRKRASDLDFATDYVQAMPKPIERAETRSQRRRTYKYFRDEIGTPITSCMKSPQSPTQPNAC